MHIRRIRIIDFINLVHGRIIEGQRGKICLSLCLVEHINCIQWKLPNVLYLLIHVFHIHCCDIKHSTEAIKCQAKNFRSTNAA